MRARQRDDDLIVAVDGTGEKDDEDDDGDIEK